MKIIVIGQHVLLTASDEAGDYEMVDAMPLDEYLIWCENVTSK